MEHNITFMPWFKDEVLKNSTTSENLTWLAAGLKFDVISCIEYEVNICIFYTKFMDENRTIQNSSVTLGVESIQFSAYKSCTWINGILWVYKRDMRG